MTVPSYMRAMVLKGHGGLDQLELRDDVAVPELGPADVLIEVVACGMNNTDINTRTGWYSKTVSAATGAGETRSDVDGSWGGGLTFPRIQGADPVGQIVAVGNEVPRSRIGQRVLVDAWIRDSNGDLEKAGYLGSERDGGYAEFVSVPSPNAHAINSDLSDIELASFPCSFATAEHMLERAGVRDGQLVLVTGASGGVGGALVQLAKRRGATVTAIAGSSKLDAVRAFGADHAIARETNDLAQAILDLIGKVDVFADVVGGPQFPGLLEIVNRGGHYTTAGAIGGPIVELDLRTLYLHDLTLHGATVLPPTVFANLVRYIENGEVRPVVAATFPLSEMRSAQEAFMRKNHVGAMVIEVAS